MAGLTIGAIIAQTAGTALFNRFRNRGRSINLDEGHGEMVAVIEQAVQDALKNDPVLRNATNSERWWQSRVIVGAGTGAAMSIFVALGILQTEYLDHGWMLQNWDWTMAGPAAGAVATTIMALYGRLRNGLSPLFNWFAK